MTKLSDTQILILRNAAQRDDRNVLPLPGSLRGGARKKVVDALLSRGLIVESQTDGTVKADDAMDRIWRNDDGDQGALDAPADADEAEAPKTRAGTKPAQLIEMLSTREGATIAEIAEATGWQPHTVRGAIAGALKKKLGLGARTRRSRTGASLPRRELIRAERANRRLGRGGGFRPRPAACKRPPAEEHD